MRSQPGKMKKSRQPASVRNVAMGLLARREHSAYELKQKLKTREFDTEAIDAAVAGLQQDNLQSDERFAESFVNQRVNAGFGPVKISYQLRQKGVDELLIEQYLARPVELWDEKMRQQRHKKFGAEIPRDYALRMKQARFLQNRGFSAESVMRLFR